MTLERTLLVALLAVALLTGALMWSVRNKLEAPVPGPAHTLSTVVETSEGPTTVVTEGDMPDIIPIHKQAIREAKGL